MNVFAMMNAIMPLGENGPLKKKVSGQPGLASLAAEAQEKNILRKLGAQVPNP